LPYLNYPAAPPPRRPRTGLFIGIVVIVAVLVVAAIGVGAAAVGLNAFKRVATPLGPVTASTTVTPTRGSVVFSDDFHDSSSGWTTDTLPSGTKFAYTAAGYVIVAKGTLDHFASSPYQDSVQQVAIAVTATQSTDSPATAGFGVSCWRGTGTAEVRYDFIVLTTGDWQVDRRDAGLTNKPTILREGTSSSVLGATPVAVHGLCATLADLHTTRLALFAGTQMVADFTDIVATLPDAGWLADLLVTSETAHVSTVTATHFEVRDLAR
jgi:hypothetical protein